MNQVAQEIQTETGYEISLVTSDKLTLVWEDCEKLLQKSCKRSYGRATTQDVFYNCLNNKTNLWIIFDKSNLNIIGAIVTQINQYPTGKRMLNIEHVAGSKMDEWMDRATEIMYRWAKDNECSGIEGIGREGFWNWIKKKENWKKTAVFFEFEFEDNK